MDTDEVDVDEHSKLLKSIASLGKRKLNKRLEKNDCVNTGSSVQLDELIGSISEKKHLNVLKKHITVTDRRSKVLRAPLHRQKQEQLERTVAYGRVSSEVRKWEDIIKKNRAAETLQFPLNQIPYKLRDVAEAVEERFQPRTKLEIESAKILQGSKHNLSNKVEYTEAEKELLKAMSLTEAKARTAEIQKARALMSYKEAKFHQQKKIKSKRYHRLKKRQQRKQMLKEFEELRSKDPEAAKEKLELLERDRIMERATLKHRGTNAWSKQMRLHSRRDPKTKELLQEQMRLGKELKEKHQYASSDTETEEKDKEASKKPKTLEEILEEDDGKLADQFLDSMNNPWLRSNLASIRGDRSVSVVAEAKEKEEEKSYWSQFFQDARQEGDKELTTTVDIHNSVDTKEPKTKKKRKRKRRIENSVATKSGESVDIDKLFDKLDSAIEQRVTDEITEGTIQSDRTRPKKQKNQRSTDYREEVMDESTETSGKSEATIDPHEYLTVQKRPRVEVSSQLIEDIEEEEDRRAEEQRRLVAEAFADDDVIADFEQEKAALEEEEKLKDIDLTLPGWGDWAGPGISSKQKKKEFIIKAPDGPPRKDKLKPGVIISEKEDQTIRRYQVSQPPFPFSSVEEFEASIRQPLGKEWNPETALISLIEPRVVTKSGATIMPMDKKLTFSKKENLESDED